MNNTKQVSSIEEITHERNVYKVAFETVMKYLDGYSKFHNDGSIILNLTLHASDLNEDNEVELDAFALIENGVETDEVPEVFEIVQ